MTALHAPHRHIKTATEKERFLVRLFDALWTRYRSRMEYVRKYEKVVAAHGAAFVNDHIAFRTLAAQEPASGIFQVSRPVEALGYAAAACYAFPDKHLGSIHYQHPNPRFPKLFITELKTWELSPLSRRVIDRALRTRRAALSEAFLASLQRVDGLAAGEREKLLAALTRHFQLLPWAPPRKKDVLALNEETQFGAWVLLNGHDVNHFTAAVHSHGVPALDDIEKTVAALRAAGVPMKKEIEGDRGTKLRQSSTEAVILPVKAKEGNRTLSIPWPYAYFEIAERPLVRNPATGREERFEGFLGGQATNLFEMTKAR